MAPPCQPDSAWISSIYRISSECPSRNASESRPWERGVLTTTGSVWLGRKLLGFEDHAEIGPGLDFGEAELLGEFQDCGLGGFEVGLGWGQSFDLDEIAKGIGAVEHDFDGVPCSAQEKGRPCLANRRDRAEAQEFEQGEQFSNGERRRRRSESRSPRGSWSDLGWRGPLYVIRFSSPIERTRKASFVVAKSREGWFR